MPNGRVDLGSIVVGATLIAGALWYVAQKQGAAGDGAPPPPGDGAPPPQVRLQLLGAPRLAVSADGVVVSASQTLDLVPAHQWLSLGVRSTWRNATGQSLWLNRYFQLRSRKPLLPDEDWLIFDPGRGVVLDFPGSQTLVPSFGGDPNALLLEPGFDTELLHLLFIAGPAITGAEAGFWGRYDFNVPFIADLSMNLELAYFQVPRSAALRQEGVNLGGANWDFGLEMNFGLL